MPWRSLLTLFDFSGFWPNSNQDSFGRNHRASLEPILTWCWPAEPAEPPAFVVWRPWSPVPVQRQAACSGCCLCCPASAHTVLYRASGPFSVPRNTASNSRLSLGFLFPLVMRWLCLSCMPWQPCRAQGTAGPWMSPFSPSPSSL